MCRQGASVIQSAVLDSIKDAPIRVYVIWVPVLETDRGGPDEKTRSLVTDDRAAHFWDAERVLSGLFADVLRLPAGYPAWDVYLIYPRGVTWESEAPAPVYWQHQLPGVATAPPLHGETFLERLRLVAGIGY